MADGIYLAFKGLNVSTKAVEDIFPLSSLLLYVLISSFFLLSSIFSLHFLLLHSLG